MKLSALSGYRLAVEFEDGVAGIISIESWLTGPVFGPLRDAAVFASVCLDPYGTPSWPNGADLAPDALYKLLYERSDTEADASAGIRLADLIEKIEPQHDLTDEDRQWLDAPPVGAEEL